MQGADVQEPPAPAIHADDLSKRYGSFEALRGVNLDVPAGSIHCLLGPNGAGKSTLIKALVGASRPSGGWVNVLGLDPVRDAARLRRSIGYMPQAAALYGDLSARDNIRFFGQAYGLPDLDARVDAALELAALTDRRNDAVFSFSGGMQQRVSLACAVVHDPRVLFLDEPTAGVDPRLKDSFWRRFREMAARGVTLFISTHLMDEAMLCDRLTILREGRVLAGAPPREIMQRGRTTIKVWRAGQERDETVRAYYTELPQVLRAYGLDSEVERIEELHEDSLETVILEMIERAET